MKTILLFIVLAPLLVKNCIYVQQKGEKIVIGEKEKSSFYFVNGKIKYPKMAEKSTHFFESEGYGIESGKTIQQNICRYAEDKYQRTEIKFII